jgi:hypothetical protein
MLYNIDTVSVYGMENWSLARQDQLISALRANGMKLVLRLESYDPETFAFRSTDAVRVVDRHSALLNRIPKELIAYVALNVPVDDPRVHERLGGVNSPAWRERQPGYVRELVARTRAVTGDQVLLFPSLFYGWDGTYQIPIYRDSGADGWFINSYSYPGGPNLINSPKLAAVLNRALAEYGPMPLVMEYGFHTNMSASQTAGQLPSREAKRLALLETTQFYASVPNVCGTIYFGYDVNKMEGEPPALIDFGLV